MSARQHTPGPWVIDDRPLYDEAGGLNATPLKKGACIATVETAWSSHSIHAPSTIGEPCPSTADMDAQGLANAELIAIAPKLLATVEKLRRMLDDKELFRDAMRSACAEVLQPLAKAEGRA